MNKNEPILVVLKVNGFYKNIFSIREFSNKDAIKIYSKGSSHNTHMTKELKNLEIIDKNKATKTEISVWPNLKSKIKTVGIHYKFHTNGKTADNRADITEVRLGEKLFPIWTSMGRNVSRKALNLAKNKFINKKIVELWKGNSLDTRKDSLCYSIFVANKSIEFVFPDDFPRNTIILQYKQFKLITVYWLYNKPTKLRGINYYETTDQAIIGYDFHEILNFTNYATLALDKLYPMLPELKK